MNKGVRAECLKIKTGIKGFHITRIGEKSQSHCQPQSFFFVSRSLFSHTSQYENSSDASSVPATSPALIPPGFILESGSLFLNILISPCPTACRLGISLPRTSSSLMNHTRGFATDQVWTVLEMRIQGMVAKTQAVGHLFVKLYISKAILSSIFRC